MRCAQFSSDAWKADKNRNVALKGFYILKNPDSNVLLNGDWLLFG